MREALLGDHDSVEDLYNDYLDLLDILKENGNEEIPTLEQFAVWRAEEFEANGLILITPSIH